MSFPEMHEILSPSVLDLRPTTNHPLTLRYSEVHSQALVEAAFQAGRAQPGVSFVASTPFLNTARIAVTNGLQSADTLALMSDMLRSYYTLVQPESAAEWLGLERETVLSNTPPWGAVFPWRARSVTSYQHAYERAAFLENRAMGRPVGIEDGWLFCGPVSEEKIQIEAERILYVLNAINDDGYQRSDESDGDVKVTALVNETLEWRWLVTGGNHRASAAAALGFQSIPVRVNLVISRADAAYWKHVVDGLFTLREALFVFDGIFYGRRSDVIQSWLNLQNS